MIIRTTRKVVSLNLAKMARNLAKWKIDAIFSNTVEAPKTYCFNKKRLQQNLAEAPTISTRQPGSFYNDTF